MYGSGTEANSATGWFCIMLAQAKQLDGKYTIFGHVLDDDVSRARSALNGLNTSHG